MKALMNEFKKFISRGNVVDMAVGVIIGGAFGKIVTSVVNDIIMPSIGAIFGGVNFTDLKYVISEATDENGVEVAEAAITYGVFIQAVIDFLIIAFSMFVVIKTFSMLKRKYAEKSSKI